MNESDRVEVGLEAIIESLEIRFEYDALGRIIRSKLDGEPPRFVLGRSKVCCLWRMRSDLSSSLVRAVSKLAGREPGFPIAEAYSASSEQLLPPERLAMIERLFDAEAASVTPARHEWLIRDGVRLAELWIID